MSKENRIVNKPSYTLFLAQQAVAQALAGQSDQSSTTIRCAINDCLDAAEKDGYRVGCWGYDQPRATRLVKEMIADIEHEIAVNERREYQ